MTPREGEARLYSATTASEYSPRRTAGTERPHRAAENSGRGTSSGAGILPGSARRAQALRFRTVLALIVPSRSFQLPYLAKYALTRLTFPA